MSFFQPAFYTPVQADANAFANLFQLLNDINGYQREAACNSSKPKQQQQQQQKTQPKVENKSEHKAEQQQQKTLAQQKQKSEQQPQQKQAAYRHPFADFFESIQSAAEASRAASLPTFHPRFDVRETENTYELHGELAGVDRNNISLEFTEPQTLVVSGKVERNYNSQSQQPVPAVENTPDAIADTDSEPDHDNASSSGARTPTDDEFTQVAAPRSPSPARSHHATVTDEETEEALERGVVATPAPTTPAPAQAPAAPTERYWHQERVVGQFKRVFSFPVPVDEANVRASLENGILSVSVPKVKREARRIVVF